MNCPVCGGNDFEFTPILWPELVEKWRLTQHEAEYIDRQQGLHCIKCGCNLRAMALGEALKGPLGDIPSQLPLVESELSHSNRDVLEVNEAGALTPFLSKIPGHKLVKWPGVDMRELPFKSESFDVVVHSDTLEHVDGFKQALYECCRVLRRGGALCFTVPILYEKVTCSTAGRAPSYHDPSPTPDEGLRVHTEFGADVWAYVLAAGFRSVEFACIEWPAGLAITARK